MTNSIAEMEESACLLVIGSNTTECHPLIATRVLRAREKGAALVVADPRRIHLGLYADVAVQHRLGTDIALLNGMMYHILANNWHDAAYIRARTEGFQEFSESVLAYTPERVEALTGVPAGVVQKMARLYAKNKPASILYAMGITQHTTGVDNVKAVCNLALLCGNVGVRGGGVNPLRGQNNVQGACDMGGLPNVLPGYQPVTDAEVRDRFAEAWGVPIPPQPGLTITEMAQAMMDGKLKALYVIGENPRLSDPDWNHLRHAMKKLDFLVVQDIFLSETAQVADVVLAAASCAEKDGTFTNSERRCLRIRQAVEPVGESLPDWRIFCLLSQAMGVPMDYSGPHEIMDEIASLAPKLYGGIRYDRLGIDGIQWPCPAPDHPGTPFLHKDRFSRGLGKFHAVEHRDPAELPSAETPFQLTTGRMFAHYHTGTMTRISQRLDAEQREGYVEIHPEDARELGIREGELVRVSSRRGELEAPARLTRRVRRGTIFVPIHFGESPANILTSAEAFDPLAKIPEFKVSAVAVSKALQ
jgi:formate dehydrogenase alpha subunit